MATKKMLLATVPDEPWTRQDAVAVMCRSLARLLETWGYEGDADAVRYAEKVLLRPAAGPSGTVALEVRHNADGTLDEVVMRVGDRCLFHLEQMDDNHWWMGVGDPDGQYVHVHLTTFRAPISGQWSNEGAEGVPLATPAAVSPSPGSEGA